MLDFRRDRLDYGQMLIPPGGHRLDRAIAATYSLDLNTLLSIPVALFYSQTLEGKLDTERFQVLEAIRRTMGVVTVYCQKGQIHVPGRYNRLYAFMEDMIVSIRMPDAFTSFHPKVWVLRFLEDGADDKPFYRVLVMSRNLTNDRSWDLAVTLEGRVTAAKRSVNRPLVDFLVHLNAIQPTPDFDRLARELERVHFEVPGRFDRVAFHPAGIDGYRESAAIGKSADAALCMSPFVDDETLNTLRTRVQGNFWLFSRRRELAKLRPETVTNYNTYCISDLVVQGESLSDVDDFTEERLEQDLHAKLFIFQSGDTCRWLVGSANATNAARTRNTEFLVELIGRDDRVTLEQAVDDLLGDDRSANVFEEFRPDSAGQPDQESEQRSAMRRLEYELAGVPLSGSVVQAANQSNYDLTVHLDLTALRGARGVTLLVGPLNYAEHKPTEFNTLNTLTFTNIKETELSRFVVFRIERANETLRRFVLRYEVSGMPATRNDLIFRSLISSKKQFLEYLQFLLADEILKEDLLPPPPRLGNRSDGDDKAQWHTTLPIFESIIAAASRHPEKLEAVDGVIQRLRSSASGDDAVLPPEFLDFWEVFRPLISPAGAKGPIDER